MNAQATNPDQNPADTVVSLKRASGHRKKATAVKLRLKIKADRETGNGLRLLQQISRTMTERGDTIEDAASAVGISTVYLRAINSGARKFADVDKDVLRRIAKYVNLPAAQVFLMAEALEPTDFFYAATVEDELSRAYRSMTSHPMWAGYAPSTEEWDAMSESTKLFTCMLFEQVTNQRFLTSAAVATESEKA